MRSFDVLVALTVAAAVLGLMLLMAR